MMKPNVIFSNEGYDPEEEISKSEILGHKAYGLFRVPTSWVPDFLVLTVYFYKKWKTGGINSAFENLYPKEKEKIFLFLEEMKRIGSHIIIRSNSPTESIETSSGKYYSESVYPNIDQVLNSIDRLCSANKENEMFVLIQRCIDRSEIIHASNERRVSKDKFHWRVEGLSEDKIVRLLEKNQHISDNNGLNAKNEKEVILCLKKIFSYLVNINTGLFHCEIAWDGKRVWLVQVDEIKEIEYTETANKYLTTKDSLVKKGKRDFNFLKPFQEIPKNEWKKLDRVLFFQELGFPTADVYLLSGQDWLEKSKEKNNPIKSEIFQLLDQPIIIRTDLKTSVSEEDIMLLTSKPIHTVEEVISFLENAQKIFSDRNIKESEWAFLFSNIYRVRASAMVHARPYSKSVQVDAVWGFADGLSYLPHDTYFMDVSNRKITKNIDYKNLCLIGIDENWRLIPIEKPLDWKPVLNNKEIRIVSEWGLRLAKYLNKEIQLMVFAHISGFSGLKYLLPWHYTTFQLTFPERSSFSICSDKSIYTIQNNNDLSRIDNIPGLKGIYLWPDVVEMRNKDFIIRIAKIAAEKKIPIIFEGSLLGHAYYAMVREGATVLASRQLFPPKEVIKYEKLVRDEIPAIVKRAGSIARVKKLLKPEAILFLKQKLIEEAFEVWNAEEATTAEELADLMEIIYSLSENINIPKRKIEEIRTEKLKKRGGFKKYIYLEETIYQQFGITQAEKGKIPLLFDEDIDLRQSFTRKGNKKKIIRPIEKNKNEFLAFEIPLIPIIHDGRALSVLHERYKDYEIIFEYHDQYLIIRFRLSEQTPNKLSSDQPSLFDW